MVKNVSFFVQIASVPFFVSDVGSSDAFGITGPKNVMTGDTFSLKCSASVYKYDEESIQWYKDTADLHSEVSTT